MVKQDHYASGLTIRLMVKQDHYASGLTAPEVHGMVHCLSCTQGLPSMPWPGAGNGK